MRLVELQTQSRVIYSQVLHRFVQFIQKELFDCLVLLKTTLQTIFLSCIQDVVFVVFDTEIKTSSLKIGYCVC